MTRKVRTLRAYEVIIGCARKVDAVILSYGRASRNVNSDHFLFPRL